MKLALSCVLVVLSVFITAEGKPADHYTNKYDNVSLDEILSNERLYKKYMDCMLDEGQCTPDGKELKDKIPEALETKCSKCNDKQKEGVKKVIEHLIKNKPEDWKKLKNKYDPDGKWSKKYEEEAKKYGITEV